MLSNYGVDAILIKWCEEAGVNFRKITYEIKREVYGSTLYIYTSRPGLLIGAKGVLYEKYKAELNKESRNAVEVEFVEVTEIMTEEEWDEYCRRRGF